MNFISNVLDSIPVVGHVKGVIHYAAGDTDGGNKAMYQSTRTTAVLAGGAVGCVAGPAGAALGGVYGGLITDGVVSIAKDEPVGIIESTTTIGQDIARGKAPIASVGSATFQIAMDGIGGLGMGGISSAVNKVPQKMVTNTVESTMKQAAASVGEEMIEKSVKLTAEEMAKLVSKKTSEKVLKTVLQQTATEAQVVLVSAHVGLSASKRTEAEIREEQEKQRRKNEEKKRKERAKCEEQERQRKEKEKSGTGIPGSSQPPQGNKDNNKTCEDAEDYLEEFEAFMKILKNLFKLIYGFIPKEFNTIFGNLSNGQKKYLVKILKRIQKYGKLDAVFEIVIKTFKEHFSEHMSFTNFLSLLEFVQSYIEDEVNIYLKTNRSATRPAMKFKERKEKAIQHIIHQKDIVKRIADLFNQLAGEIRAETLAPNNISPDFRDIFSAVYHYFKHRCVPGDGVLTVKKYYNLIRQLLEKLKKSPKYGQAQNASGPQTIICEMYIVIYGRMFRIVVKVCNGEIVLSSAYVVTMMCVNVKEGTVIIKIIKEEE